MDASWNNLGKAFWNGGIFGVAKTMLDEKRSRPQVGDPMPNWKVFPILAIDDRGFRGFTLEDPKWLEKMRDVQAVTMARPYPTLRDLECDLVGMRLVTGEEIGELKEIGDFILKTYGKKSSMEVRVQMSLRPREAPGPTVALELMDDEIRLLRIVTAFMLGHMEGGGLPGPHWSLTSEWGSNDECIRSLCHFAAKIPLRAGTMGLGAAEYLGLSIVAIAAGEFLTIIGEGPLRGGDKKPGDWSEFSPFVHFDLFTARDLPEFLAAVHLPDKLATAGDRLEQALPTVRLHPAPQSAASPPPVPPSPQKARPKVFVFGPDCPMTGFGQWTECLRKAKESLPETTDLLALSLEMFHSGRLSSAERAQWADKAHEIKDFMGVDNLCEVPVRIDL